MEESLNNKEMSQPPKNKKKRLLIIGIIIAALIIIGSVIGWFKYQEAQKEKYAKIQAETIVNMQIESILSALIISKYSEVWSNAIDNGNDFNVALANFKDGLEESDVIKDREKAQDKIRNNMKLLQNPPDEYLESYIATKELYGTYTKMAEQTMSPSGSLIEFNRKTNDLFSQFQEQKENVEISLPADVKKIKKEIEKEKEKEQEKKMD